MKILNDYDGTILFVSHDRYLLNKLLLLHEIGENKLNTIHMDMKNIVSEIETKEVEVKEVKENLILLI